MRFRILLATVAVAALSACGGGSTSRTSNPAPVAALAITPQNAEETAAQSMSAAQTASSVGDSAFGFGGAVGAVVESGPESVANVALAMAERAEQAIVNAVNLGAVGVVIEQSQQCGVTGSVTIQINTGSISEMEYTAAVEAGAIPAGTSVTMIFNGCVEADQGAIDGAITMTFREFTIDAEPGLDTFTIDIGVSFDDFEANGGRIDGDINLLLASESGAVDVSVSGNSLLVSAAGESMGLLEYSVDVGEDNVQIVQSYNFTLDASQLGGRVTVTTESALVTDFGADYPMSGTVRITGGNNTSLTVTALDSVNVQLEVDSDGDGAANVTIVTTWAELEAAAA